MDDPPVLPPDQRYAVAGNHILRRQFEDELTVINMDSGAYYSIGGSALAMWDLLELGASPDELTAHLTAQFDVGVNTAEQDVRRIVSILLADSLILVYQGEGLGSSAPAEPRRPYEAPWVETFDDLQDLLLLDPVHDVSGGAWPGKPIGHQA